ncbi:hypothetical protein DSO57_1013738 [Entomophthora muscae]|uniref:Uncharacterized protein n=1 Tax=Entomophthora muscae TaxID=34485 RepID=A0ACC2US96_9FUNG|nr:hypothetical protein DSO57_1013738 [Entomophthora muscae]
MSPQNQSDKRPGSPPSASDAGAMVIKKPKSSESKSGMLSKSSVVETGLQKIPRTSRLEAPIMHLTGGHEGEVLTARFDPSGQHIASAGFDRSIVLWNTYGDCKSYGVLKGHRGAILEVQFNHDATQLYSASSDYTIGVWDTTTGELIKRLKGHSSFVNSVCPQLKFAGDGIIISASDDRTLKMWDLRRKNPVMTLPQEFPVTSTCFSAAGDMAFVGSIDDTILAYDLRQQVLAYSLIGHNDTVSGIRLSPDGATLLSYAMDNTVRIWDVKPFAAGSRCLKTFEGAPHGFEKNLIKPSWSRDGGMVATGGGDRSVTIWEVATGRLAYKLPGHKGCVNQVDFHPTEPIILSGSTDRTLFLGEVLPE